MVGSGQLLQLLVATSMLLLLHCLHSAKGTSCSTCMANIIGPHLENQTPNTVETVRVTESVPAVIVCRYVCHDSNYERYNFDLRIDILDPRLQIQEHEIISTQNYENNEHNFRVTRLSHQQCSQTSNEAIAKYQIHIESRDTPTLIAKCFVVYSPNAPSGLGSIRCSNTLTLAIERAPDLNCHTSTDCDHTSTCILRTDTPSPSPCVTPTMMTVTATVTVTTTTPGPNVSTLSKNETCPADMDALHQIYGSILGIVFLVMTATAVILLMIVCGKCVQCRSRESEPEPRPAAGQEAGEPGHRGRLAWISDS